MKKHNRQGKRRVTQGDVAKRANVSQAMVSYIVNDNHDVKIPLETRQRVLAAMDELGYVPNVTARRLRASKSYTIAGIIPDITNPFYPEFERGIQDVVNHHDYDLIMYNTDGDPKHERKCLESIQQGRVDGVVGVFFHLRVMDLTPLLERGIFVVRLEAIPKMPGSLPLDNIYINNVAAGQAAVEHLIQKGHRRIGMLSSNEGPAHFRAMGFREALAAHQIPFEEQLLITDSYSEDGGYRMMSQLLALEPPPTAIFAANDLLAMGAMLAIREAGLKIPKDVAVIGFDDIPTAKLVYPSLSTVAQFQRELGRKAAEMLFERLDGTVPSKGRSQEMPYKLIVRNSV